MYSNHDIIKKRLLVKKNKDILSDYSKLFKSSTCLNICNSNVEDLIEIDPSNTSLHMNIKNLRKTSYSKFKVENDKLVKTFTTIPQNPPSNHILTRSSSQNLLSFTKRIHNKMEIRSFIKKSPNSKLSLEDKIFINKLKFPQKKPSVDPIISMIKVENLSSLLPTTFLAKKNSLINEEKKKIYKENEIDITITNSYNQEEYQPDHEWEHEDIVEKKKVDTIYNKNKFINEIKKSMKQILIKCYNEKFYEDNEKRVNYIEDIYQAPLLKNRLIKNFYSNSQNNTKLQLSGIENLRNRIINPNFFNHKINLHINNIKQEYQKKKDEKTYKNKNNLNIQTDYKIDYTYKYLQTLLNEKFKHLKNFPDLHNYFRDKYLKYEPKLWIIDENFPLKIIK